MFGGKAFAAVISEQKQIEDGRSSLRFVNRATIEGEFAGQTIQFIDDNPFDTTYNYKPSSEFFCSSGDTVNGITIKNNAISLDKFGNVASSAPAEIDLDFTLGVSSQNGCNDTSPNKLPGGVRTENKAFIGMAWEGSSLVSLPGVSNELSLVPLGENPPAESLLVRDKTDRCYGGDIVLLDNNNQGTKYRITNKFLAGYPDASANSRLRTYFTDDKQCYIVSSFPISIFGVRDKQAPLDEQLDGDNTSDCVNDNTGFEWFFCPVTLAISEGVDKMESLITSQLEFDVDKNLSDEGGVHRAWALIRNIVSALLVILMLVMVFSQAMGGGPFEAYTVRKMLPRIVIAVVALQLSWEICQWFIAVANDLGNGVRQLLTAPFGGAENMDLNNILHKLDSKTWELGSQLIIPALLVGGVIVSFVALPGAFVLAFSLFIGVFAALAVLLFRNVLIMALTLFAPLAIIAWVLSGTQNYWKLWKDNFLKLLMLFPLIMAIIYTGRIFAGITAEAAGNNQTAGPIDYMIILVAYFGPYFIIFKAYKWGGSLLSGGGMAIANARRGITNANAPWLRTLGERAQGNLAKRYGIATKESRQRYAAAAQTESRIQRLQEAINKRRAEGRGAGLFEAAQSKLQDRHRQQVAEALAAQKQEGKLKRAGLRIGAGKPLPTRRQQLETIAKGAQYQQELVDQKKALVHTDFVEQLNSGASVGDAKKYIRDKYGWSTDEFTDRAFNNWLVDTNSGMELEDTEWRTAGGSRPDLAKTYGFIGMMNGDSERYKKVAGWLPELQPFNQALGGGPKSEDFLVGGKRLAEVRQRDPAVAARLQAGGPQALELAELLADDARYAKIFQNLEHTSDIATWRPGQLQMMANNIQKMKSAGIETSQAEAELKQILNELKVSRTPEATSTLQRLMGGKKSARQAVNLIMEDDKWLEDALNVPVTTSEGVGRITALPSEQELRAEDVQARVRSAILDNLGDPRRPGLAFEIAQAISEDPMYALEAQGITQDRIFEIVREAREATRTSRNQQAINNLNALMDQAVKNAQDRAQRVIRQAIARNPPPDEIRRIEEQATNDARQKIKMLQDLKLLLPEDDPTAELRISHED
ncbi:MAG: hypothetical protein WD877_00650 [Candidatus Saccharimonadales bacterium]